MNLAELTICLQKGETLHAEFKQWPLHPDELAAAIVAFANTDGGQILLGVNDQGQVVGIDENERDRVARTVDNVAYNNIEPPATVVVETVADEYGHNVLVVNVPKGSQRPYRTNRGLYFVRTASGKRQASREELLRLFQAVESLYYDEVPLRQSSLADIEAQARDDLLQMVKERGIDVESVEPNRVLLNWNLLHQSNGHLSLTVAGALFLARQPQRLLPTAYVSAVRIPGDDISLEPSDQKHIEGRLLNVLEDSLRFLRIHLPRPHRIQGLDPEWQSELPDPLLREALVNALAHRDYTIPAPIRLIIFDDMIEIRTPGKLPNSVTLESLPLGVHVLRNPMIYSTFLRIGLVTDVGSGIPRIIRLTRQATGREPNLRADASEFILSLPRRKPDTSS
ncbi:MAG: RNA-binding domain-containing protein [Blastocatellia bacterium]